MMAIDAARVKALREATGAGMMDCKHALLESGGDTEAAIDWLRARGLMKAAKKAGRTAAEGLVGLLVEGREGVLVELNSETDFLARTEAFQKVVSDILVAALATDGTRDAVEAAPLGESGRKVADCITETIAAIGENVTLRRTQKLRVRQGSIASYVHNSVAPGMGKIAVLVALDSTLPAESLQDLGRKIAMHIAAQAPAALSEGDISPDLLERERAVLREQAKASGKPEAVIGKMVEGRLRKFIEETTLLTQPFVIDPALRVGEAVEQAAGELGAPIAIAGFVRFAVGEGIEKESPDFSAEVAAAAGP